MIALGFYKGYPHKARFHDPDLSRIRADEKRQEILGVLHSEIRTIIQDCDGRLLRFAGYDEAEILDIIDKGNSWQGFIQSWTFKEIGKPVRRAASFEDIQ